MVGPTGDEHWAFARYKIIQFQRKFAVLDAFADTDGNINKDLPQSNWEVTFTGNGQKTLVEFSISYDDLSQLEAILQMGFKEGLTMAKEELDELFNIFRIQTRNFVS